MSGYSSEQSLRYLAKRRAKAKAYLDGVCRVCGTTEDLQFDHIDPTTKVIEISSAIALHWSWQKLLVELDKCQLLCKLHHIEKTRLNKEHVGGHNKILDPQHGTCVMYTSHRCRCDLCKAWKRSARKNISSGA